MKMTSDLKGNGDTKPRAGLMMRVKGLFENLKTAIFELEYQLFL